MRLQDLDERFVPAMAEWLDRQLKRFPTPPEPSGPAPLIVRLRRLDDRWTPSGPLALFREIPQLGAVVIGALVLAGSVTVRIRAKPAATAAPQASASPTAAPEPSSGHLGPQVGDRVTTYLAQSQARLFRIASGQPDGTAVAVISFTSYRTPAQVRDLVGPLQVRRVFFRAPLALPQTVPHSVGVEDVVRDSRKEFLRVAALRTHQANTMLQFAATITNDPAQKAEHEKDAAVMLREATVLKGPCKCVYAVVVRTRLRLLLDLVKVRGIRAIDASPPGALLADFEYSGLLPEEKVTVTGGNQAAG